MFPNVCTTHHWSHTLYVCVLQRVFTVCWGYSPNLFNLMWAFFILMWISPSLASTKFHAKFQSYFGELWLLRVLYWWALAKKKYFGLVSSIQSYVHVYPYISNSKSMYRLQRTHYCCVQNLPNLCSNSICTLFAPEVHSTSFSVTFHLTKQVRTNLNHCTTPQ